jgi:predicted dehydrogenase
MKKVIKMIKLGIIGLSEGNGHPYSWSAIFNGYDRKYMDKCPFPVIPEYLYKQNYPKDFLTKVKVTHIWTQNKELSEHVASSSNIEHVVENYMDMIGQVDGILMARDDPENHKKYATPFIEAGLPIYIDKPIATDIDQLDYFKNIEKYPDQICSCSALRYAKEYSLIQKDLDEIGNIQYIDAYTMKSWKKYAVHLIDPVIKNFLYDNNIVAMEKTQMSDKTAVTVEWDNGILTRFNSFEKTVTPMKLEIYGDKGKKTLIFKDSFNAFKSALREFIEICFEKKGNKYSFNYLQKVVEIVNKGME